MASHSYITRHQQYWLPSWRLAPLPVILLRDQLLSCPYLNITALHYGLPSHSCWYLFYEHWRDQQCCGLSIPGFAGLSNKFVFYNSCVLGDTWGLNMDVTSSLYKAASPLIFFSMCADCKLLNLNHVLLCFSVTGIYCKIISYSCFQKNFCDSHGLFLLCCLLLFDLFCVVFPTSQ